MKLEKLICQLELNKRATLPMPIGWGVSTIKMKLTTNIVICSGSRSAKLFSSPKVYLDSIYYYSLRLVVAEDRRQQTPIHRASFNASLPLFRYVLRMRKNENRFTASLAYGDVTVRGGALGKRWN